jgi:hypothetical protein
MTAGPGFPEIMPLSNDRRCQNCWRGGAMVRNQARQ